MNWAVKLIEKLIFKSPPEGLYESGYVNGISDSKRNLVLAVLEKNKEIEKKLLKELKKCKLCKINHDVGWGNCLIHLDSETIMQKDKARAFRELVKEMKKVKTK